MKKRTIQEIADFFDVPMEWDGEKVLFRISPATVTSDFNTFIEKPDTHYVIQFEPRKNNEHRDFSAYEPSETEYTDHTVSYGRKYCEACWGELDTGFRCMKCGRQYHPRRGSVVAIAKME